MSLAGRWMRRVRFGLLCRSLYRDQYASQIVPSLPADPMLGEPAADPEEKRGPASDKIGVVSLKALDHHRPNREESCSTVELSPTRWNAKFGRMDVSEARKLETRA